MAIGDVVRRRSRLRPVVGGLKEGDFGRRKGEPRAGGTGRYKGDRVNIHNLIMSNLNNM